VLTAIAATGLLMQRAGIAGNRLSSGSAGAIVARFDLAVPLLVGGVKATDTCCVLRFCADAPLSR